MLGRGVFPRGELQVNLPISQLSVCFQAPFRKVYLGRVWREPGEMRLSPSAECRDFTLVRVAGLVSGAGTVTPRVLLLKKDPHLTGPCQKHWGIFGTSLKAHGHLQRAQNELQTPRLGKYLFISRTGLLFSSYPLDVVVPVPFFCPWASAQPSCLVTLFDFFFPLAFQFLQFLWTS